MTRERLGGLAREWRPELLRFLLTAAAVAVGIYANALATQGHLTDVTAANASRLDRQSDRLQRDEDQARAERDKLTDALGQVNSTLAGLGAQINAMQREVARLSATQDAARYGYSPR